MKRATACLAGLLLGNLVLVLCASEPAGNNVRASAASDTNNLPAPVSERDRQEWALGCAAVLTERNHDSHTLLGGCPLTAGNKAEKKRLLSDAWGVNNREEFLETLKWVDEGGHRASFEKLGGLMALLTERQYQALLARASDPEARNKMRVVREYHAELGRKGLYGWDYSRAICLCRWAYVAGYIEEKEARERIMPMATLLQERFESWEDLGRNYLIGRQFWSLEQTREDGWRCEDAFQRLLDMRSSPWNRHPWQMSLKGDEDGTPRRPRQPEEEPREKPNERKGNMDRIAEGSRRSQEDQPNG
jgi:hypothetical protein